MFTLTKTLSKSSIKRSIRSYPPKPSPDLKHSIKPDRRRMPLGTIISTNWALNTQSTIDSYYKENNTTIENWTKPKE